MENKKSFLAYADWKGTFDILPDDIAGKLVKHLFAYVNDENPISDELIVNAVFEPIKATLKRDLYKWEIKTNEKSHNGRLGNLKRYYPDIYEQVKNELITLEKGEELAKFRKESHSDNKPSLPIANLAVSDSVSDSVIKLYKNVKFIEIKNFNAFISSFELNKNYLKIARRFWKLWKLEHPVHKTLNDAKVINWYESVRLMIEVDNQSIERLICIYKYFEKCQQKDKSFSDYWFTNIMSIPAMRKTNKDGVYRLDMIMKDVNDKIDKDDAFNRLITDSINNFKNYTDESD